jgi:glutathione S-transferase
MRDVLLGPDPHALRRSATWRRSRRPRSTPASYGRGSTRSSRASKYVAGQHLTHGRHSRRLLRASLDALDIERPDLKNVKAWYERLKARPAYAKHVMPRR